MCFKCHFTYSEKDIAFEVRIQHSLFQNFQPVGQFPEATGFEGESLTKRSHKLQDFMQRFLSLRFICAHVLDEFKISCNQKVAKT